MSRAIRPPPGRIPRKLHRSAGYSGHAVAEIARLPHLLYAHTVTLSVATRTS